MKCRSFALKWVGMFSVLAGLSACKYEPIRSPVPIDGSSQVPQPQVSAAPPRVVSPTPQPSVSVSPSKGPVPSPVVNPSPIANPPPSVAPSPTLTQPPQGAQPGAPVLFFSDLDWGPRTGWEGSLTQGAAITVWGLRLGATRGANTLTINGATLTSDNQFAEWGVLDSARGLQRITFWVPSQAAIGLGTISVSVAGKTSNTLSFTVTSTGTIYFVSPTGSNSNNGLVATALGGGNGPFKDLFMFNPGLDGYHTAANRNPSGDGQYIVYARGGTYTTLDADNAFITLRGPYGGPEKRKALVAYPGEVAVAQNRQATRGLFWGANYSPYGRLDYFTIAKIKMVGGQGAIGTWGDYIRIVGNQFEDMRDETWSGVVMVDNSQHVAVYGNLFKNCGYDSYKHNIYIKTHKDYMAGDKSVDDVNVGWNEFADPFAGSDNRGGAIFVSIASDAANKAVNNVRIYSNYFHGGNMEFIYTGDNTPLKGVIHIYNNIFMNNTAGSGSLFLAWGTNDVFLTNNLFYQSATSSIPLIAVTAQTKSYFRNNIWYAKSGQNLLNLETYQGATVDSKNDLFFDPAGGTRPISGANITVSGALNVDPKLQGPTAGNFHPQAASPVIDAGGEFSMTMDFDGLSRPLGARPDIGPYEVGP